MKQGYFQSLETTGIRCMKKEKVLSEHCARLILCLIPYLTRKHWSQ